MVGVLCVERLSRITWTSKFAGYCEVDLDEKLLEFLCPMPLHSIFPAPRPLHHVECREQVYRSMPNVVVACNALAVLGLIGRTGWARSSAWICDFSSTQSTTALSGGFMYRPTMSRTFLNELRVLRQTKRLGAMRLQSERAPNTPYRRVA